MELKCVKVYTGEVQSHFFPRRNTIPVLSMSVFPSRFNLTPFLPSHLPDASVLLYTCRTLRFCVFARVREREREKLGSLAKISRQSSRL